MVFPPLGRFILCLCGSKHLKWRSHLRFFSFWRSSFFCLASLSKEHWHTLLLICILHGGNKVFFSYQSCLSLLCRHNIFILWRLWVSSPLFHPGGLSWGFFASHLLSWAPCTMHVSEKGCARVFPSPSLFPVFVIEVVWLFSHLCPLFCLGWGPNNSFSAFTLVWACYLFRKVPSMLFSNT